MSTIDKIGVELALRDSGFRGALQASRGLVGAAEAAIVGAAKRIGGALETTLKVGATAGAAATSVGLGFAIKSAIDFESQLSAVRKTTGLVGGDLDQFSGRIKDLARTLPGVSVDDLFSAAAEGGRQGISGAEELTEYVKTIGMMKVALDDIPVEESSNSIGKLAANFGLTSAETRGLASALNKLDDTTKASAAEILQATLESSQMANALGISADKALALSSGLVEAGMSGDKAGTAFTQIMRRVSSEQETFANLAGVSAQEYSAALEQGPLAALELVIRRLQDVAGKQGGVAAIQDMVGAEVVDQQQTQALLSLVQTWDQLGDRAGQANHELKTSESLLKEMEISGETTEKQLGLLWNQFSLAGEAVGSNFLPGIKAATKHLGEASDRFAQWAEGGALDWIEQFGVDLADVFGSALEDWPGAIALLGKLFDSLYARIDVGVQKIRASLLNALAEIQAQAPFQLAGDANQTRNNARQGIESARLNQERADAELKQAWNRQLMIGRQARLQIEVNREETIAGPAPPPEIPAARVAAAAEFAERQRAMKEGKGPRKPNRPKAPAEAITDQEFMARKALERIRGDDGAMRGLLGGDATARQGAIRIVLESKRKREQEEEEGRLKEELKRDDTRREDAKKKGQDPNDPDADKRRSDILTALEGIRLGKFKEAEGKLRDEFARGEAERGEERAAAMQEKMFSVQSGGADDFASAVQAGIGKTGDIQKEIRDFNRRQAELLTQIARAFDEVYLAAP